MIHGSDIALPFVALTLVLFGFALMFLLIRKNRLGKERDVLFEVFEGSVNARLIVDSGLNPIFFNKAMNGLCKPHGEPGLTSLKAFFSGNLKSEERFQLIIDNARRGMADTVELSVPRDPEDPSGTQQWYVVAASPVQGWAGYIHWRVEEITYRHQDNETLRLEHEKLIDFTDNAPVGFYSCDQDGRLLFVNATLARWWGGDINSLTQKARLHSFLENPPEGGKPYDITKDGGTKQNAEIAMKGPFGKIFQAAINQSVVIGADGQVRTRGVVHDLTEERQMRRALQESEDRFLTFFEEAPLAIAIIDSFGHINDCNQAMAKALGMKIEAIEGRPFADLIGESKRTEVVSALETIEDGGSLREPIDIRLIGDEAEVYVQMHARKFSDKTIILHFIDLTQQKSLEAQFAQSQKMQAVGQLAGGIAHDFNNLLTAMIGFCDLLLLRHKAGDPSFGDIMQIKQNSNRAANLVRQLLAFSRQQQLQPKVLDVTDVLTELSHLLRRLIGVNIEMDVVHDPKLGLVKVDQGQFEQVMINLVVNARDAMDGKGELEIITGNYHNKKPVKRGADNMPAGKWVSIEVKDTGCGIPQDNIERIFEPFFTTKDIGSGTGLGLATVYGIIRQTGGYIHVDSKMNEGTSFIIYLPFHEVDGKKEDVAEKEEAAPSKDLTGTATILLVDDEDAVRTFSARALSNKGYKVLEAANGAEALEILEDYDGPLELLVTDVIMPEVDGPELARQVLEARPTLPVIFVSGFTEERFKEEFGENAFFLPKPFTLQQLAEKVKDVLDEQ